MDLTERASRYARFISNPYITFLNRMGMLIDVASAEGATVASKDGRQFVDCIAGYGNCIVGHNPPAVIDAVTAELRSSGPFNLPFVQDIQVQLAEKLAGETPGDLECSYIVNSGSEAVETALKLVRLATGRPGIVCTRGAWHGFTFGCLSISEQSMCRQFRPMLDGVKYVTFGDSTAIDAAIDEQTGCVIVEPIQSENGAVVPPGGYLRELQDICRRRGVLLVFDEVKTGIAKTGRLFACEFDGAVPDILVCGKALGGGVMPVGAVVSRREAWGRFGLSFPMSSSSGSGNAPACAAALATLELVRAEDLCSKAERQGSRLIAALRTTARSYPEKILDVSGRGLLIGVKTPSLNLASRIVSQCAKLGVLVMNAFCDRTKILVEPPACISDAQVGIVEQVFKEAVAACPL